MTLSVFAVAIATCECKVNLCSVIYHEPRPHGCSSSGRGAQACSCILAQTNPSGVYCDLSLVATKRKQITYLSQRQATEFQLALNLQVSRK